MWPGGLRRGLGDVWPLLVIGIGRLVVHKEIDYQVRTRLGGFSLSLSLSLLWDGTAGARGLAISHAVSQEHTSEYGVHWNFFFTLSVVHAVWCALRIPRRWVWAAAALVLLANECLQSLGGG